MTTFQRIRITIDMNTVALTSDTPMSELAKTLRGLADRAVDDGFLGWSEIEDGDGSICGELQIQTIEEDDEVELPRELWIPSAVCCPHHEET